MTTDSRHHKGRRRVNLALQGGGAHGAFTWGVLERLISDGRIFIDGISGTSAGAMNAVVFTDGFLRGRQRGAIDALRIGNSNNFLHERRLYRRPGTRSICAVFRESPPLARVCRSVRRPLEVDFYAR